MNGRRLRVASAGTAAAVALIVTAGLASSTYGRDGSVVTGYLTSITVDDQSFTRGTSRAERRYVVRVTLDSIQDVVLGFGESGQPLAPQRGMLEVLLRAMENRWRVSLRLRRDVSDASNRTHARIVSVSARP